MLKSGSPSSPADTAKPSESSGTGRADGVPGVWGVKDAWHVLLAQRRTIAYTLAVGAAVIAALAIALRGPRLFEARAQLLVQPQVWQPLDESAGMDVGPQASYYDAQFRILRSRSLARRTLAALGTPTDSSAIGHFLQALTVTQVPESRVLELRFRAQEASFSALALNRHLESYIEASLEASRKDSTEASHWLAAQVEEQRRRVEAAESELRNYERRTGAVESDQHTAVQRASELGSAAVRARAQRIARESAYQQAEAARSSGRALSEVAALLPTTVIQHLSIELATLQRQDQEMAGRYGPRHPERAKNREAMAFTESRLESEVANALEGMKREVDAARAEEQRLTAAMTAQNVQTAALGRRFSDAETLRRRLATERELLERLRQRSGELGVAGNSAWTNIRILDPAEVPERALPDPTWRYAALGMGLSLLAALTLAFALHYADERVRPQDVTAHLGLPYLGLVPEIPNPDVRHHVATPHSAPPAFREALRDLRTHVLFTPGGQNCKALLVTSTLIAEGKTMVALNLAAGLARVGHHVLLIDLDLRRPRAHQAFSMTMEPGLAELLAGSTTSREAIRPTPVPGLWLLSAGRSVTSPGDLLGSAAFRELMHALPPSFDRVVIDSPPVMACADATAIAHQDVGILFVIGADRTARRAAQAALDRLEAVGARFVGAVLNRVDLSRNGAAYYPHYDPAYAEYLQPTAGAYAKTAERS
jgi:succinoglycan biosynthesis transport protein ExoP